MTLLQLGVCAGSIYTTFLIWGLLQERCEFYMSRRSLSHGTRKSLCTDTFALRSILRQ